MAYGQDFVSHNFPKLNVKLKINVYVFLLPVMLPVIHYKYSRECYQALILDTNVRLYV